MVNVKAPVISDQVLSSFHVQFTAAMKSSSRGTASYELPLQLPKPVDSVPGETIETFKMQIEAELKKYQNFKQGLADLEKEVSRVEDREIVIDEEVVMI